MPAQPAEWGRFPDHMMQKTSILMACMVFCMPYT
jgi:hypothetical protein